jgi:hypothetical protein
VRVEEWEFGCDWSVGSARLQPLGLRLLASCRKTSSGMAVWYPRNGEGQDGVVDFVPNKVRNAWPRASFGQQKE